MYPVTVVLTVAVTLPFVHVPCAGLYVNVVFDVVKPVTLPVAVLLLALTFPAASFTHT